MTTSSTSLPAPGARVTCRAASLLMGLAILVALLGAPFVLDNYYLHGVIIWMIFLVPADGLNLIVGYMGMLSLAQGAFFGIGSYVSALAAMHFGTPFYVNFILAGLVTGLIALPLGIPALRLRTYSFVMCTLGLVVIGEAVAKNWVGLTRGDLGLSAVPQPVLGFGAHPFTVTTITGYYYLYLVIAVVMTGLFYPLVTSPAGRSMIAIRDNEIQAEAFGIPTWNYKLVVFTISAAFADFSGRLYPHLLPPRRPPPFQLSSSP